MGGHGSRQAKDPDCLDSVFEALGHRHRRRILSGLIDADVLHVGDLVSVGDGGVDQPPTRLEAEFYHSHLPKLADTGFVEWDGESVVTRGPKFEEIATVIELFDEHGNRLPCDWP